MCLNTFIKNIQVLYSPNSFLAQPSNIREDEFHKYETEGWN